MTHAKKILITTESHEFFIVRVNGGGEVRGFCADCAADVELVRIDESVSASGLRAREIFRLAETGKIHFIETVEGHLLLCRDSLKTYIS